MASSSRLSIRISPKLRRELQRRASAKQNRESQVVRQALEEYISSHGAPETCYELARRAGLIGAIKDAPRDLSTGRKRFTGFGSR